MRYRLVSKGDWSKTENWLKRIKTLKNARQVLDRYGREGVAALSAATPVDTGETASSWSYRVEQTSGSTALIFTNNSQHQPVYRSLYYFNMDMETVVVAMFKVGIILIRQLDRFLMI